MNNIKQENKVSFCSFIPQRLKVESHPELINLPLNVMFASFATENGQNAMGSVIYQPDSHSYKDNEDKQEMCYRNEYDFRHWLRIIYNRKDKSYSGLKYYNNECVGSADGADWDGFFQHFTMLGLVKGERCKLEIINKSKATE